MSAGEDGPDPFEALSRALAEGPDSARRARDPTRISGTLDLLRGIWEANPDMRLMQLLVSAVPPGPNPVPHLFHLEDDALADLLRRLYLPAGPPPPSTEDGPAAARPGRRPSTGDRRK